jgi:hypothetical protein
VKPPDVGPTFISIGTINQAARLRSDALDRETALEQAVWFKVVAHFFVRLRRSRLLH